ncbi:hypothetical protein BC939DRAFT_480773 [Gamsiella multidivaricata]|uniref:uncharacterized protein n=1 Tax=Gamsiella multidivaricata TaxID=101098 RepID=UPI0022202545|nr:uncharacterized protein BC939DRAFT_480773 [Gamsiella multidivaricata]KAG0353806.1 hypothetical protein BGZ54_002036 [Gamsiella multidivaricata]KAI7817912.1 hypothetical protein BC939DRAFT_480773 [Gamsiella multidivaricata]
MPPKADPTSTAATTAVSTTPKPAATKTATKAPAKPTTIGATNTATTATTATTGTATSTTTGTLGPSSTAAPGASTGGLSTPAIAGIAVGGLVVLFLLSIFLCKKRRAHMYAKRDYSHDPSRDPINPNDVFPLENKYDQRTLPPSEGHDDLDAITYPLTLRAGGNDQRPGQTQQAQHTQQQDYPTYDEHIQSHFSPESPNLQPRGSPVGGPPGAPGGQAHIPAPILINPLNDNPPRSPNQQNSPRVMSPLSPRSHQQPPGPDSVFVNDMGNQFVLEDNGNNGRQNYNDPNFGNNINNSTERLRDSFDDGSVVQSEHSYRRPPRKSQDSNVGGGYPVHSPSAPYFNHGSGPASPNGPGPQQRGARPGPPNSNSSAYSSPRQGPSHPSPRPSHAQYQPPQPYSPQQPYPQQPGYPQHPQQPRPMYGPGPASPPAFAQQRPNNYPVRSPPMGPRGPGGYPQGGPPGYSQPSPNFSQPSPNYRPRPNYS